MSRVVCAFRRPFLLSSVSCGGGGGTKGDRKRLPSSVVELRPQEEVLERVTTMLLLRLGIAPLSPELRRARTTARGDTDTSVLPKPESDVSVQQLSPAVLLEDAMELPSISGCVNSFGMTGGLDLGGLLPMPSPDGPWPMTCIKFAGVEVQRISFGLKGLNELDELELPRQSETSVASHVSSRLLMSPAVVLTVESSSESDPCRRPTDKRRGDRLSWGPTSAPFCILPNDISAFDPIIAQLRSLV